MTKKILIGCVTALAIILFLALNTRKPNWFIESVKNGKYTIEGNEYRFYYEDLEKISNQ